MLAPTRFTVANRQLMLAAAGYLRVECLPGRPAEVDGVFRDLALRCINTQAMGVMVLARDADPGAEKALRVALTTMVLAGLPARFRLALVVQTAPAQARYRVTQRDLVAANLDARLFDSEDAAARWLDAS